VSARRRSLVLRRLAVEILQAVVSGSASLASLLPQVLGGDASHSPKNVSRKADRTAPGLDARERAWVQALVYTALRWYPRLDAMMTSLLARPLPRRDAIVRVLLLQGLTELHHFGTADHAAIAETAELARVFNRPHAVGLVNAILRRSQREQERLNRELDASDDTRYACPAWLVDAIRAGWPEASDSILQAVTAQAPLALRINRLRGTRESFIAACHAAGLAVEVHPEVPTAVQLSSAVDVGSIPGFLEGWVSVQDAAAQWAAVLLDAQPGMRVLDACAAPGGKTSHLLEAAGGDLRLTAVDIDPLRLERVRSNLERLGLSAQLVAGDWLMPDPWWDGECFDRILLDVPCSATGTLRRHPDLKLLRRPDDIPRLAAQQACMLDQAARLLCPGGQILYVTCSLLPAENEDVVAAWLGRNPEFCEVPSDFAGACRRRVGSATIMGREGMDGFYYALLRREDAGG
jgi:16S rRNA (cytosine967-C5)-methyltransferase